MNDQVNLIKNICSLRTTYGKIKTIKETIEVIVTQIRKEMLG